ncbi:MAG: hypothetical protein FWC17_06525, partial [Treponema sp.]|nr:hypothetical protein [Treponema sp.]
SVSLQSRRLIYNQSLDFMEAVIGRAADSTGSRNGDAGDQGLLLSNARLEQTIAEMQKTIDSFTSGGTGLERRLAELEETVASLRSDNAALEQEAAAKDRTISAMQGENSTLTAANASLTSTNAALTSTNTNLTSQLNRINTINSANELRIRELEDQLKAAGLLLTD